MNSDAWNSHEWSSANGRQIAEPDRLTTHRHCSRCRRDFVEDARSGERHAVHVGVFTLNRLPDHISRQWLDELCPGEPSPLDLEIRSRLTHDSAK